MKSTRSAKILAFSSFVVILVLAFVLVGAFQNQSDAGLPAGIYVLVVAIIALSLTNLLQIMRLTADTIRSEDYLKKSFAQVDEQDYTPGTASPKQQAEEEKLDPEAYAEQIIPPSESGQTLSQFSEKLLSNAAGPFELVQGLFYVRKQDSDEFTIAGKYAYYGEEEPQDFELGKALPGQTAKNQKSLRLNKIPENYFTILSGLGSSSPSSLLFVPVIHQEKTIGLIELAAFKNFEHRTEELFNALSEKIGNRLTEFL